MPDPLLIPGCESKKKRADLYETIYKAYPKHVGKAAALRAIRVAMNNKGVPFELLLERTKNFAARNRHKRGTPEWKFVPHPATWFRRESWLDENGEVKPIKTAQPGHDPKVQAEWDLERKFHENLAWTWWRQQSVEFQTAARKRWPSYPEGHVVLHEFDAANRPGLDG